MPFSYLSNAKQRISNYQALLNSHRAALPRAVLGLHLILNAFSSNVFPTDINNTHQLRKRARISVHLFCELPVPGIKPQLDAPRGAGGIVNADLGGGPERYQQPTCSAPARSIITPCRAGLSGPPSAFCHQHADSVYWDGGCTPYTEWPTAPPAQCVTAARARAGNLNFAGARFTHRFRLYAQNGGIPILLLTELWVMHTATSSGVRTITTWICPWARSGRSKNGIARSSGWSSSISLTVPISFRFPPRPIRLRAPRAISVVPARRPTARASTLTPCSDRAARAIFSSA